MRGYGLEHEIEDYFIKLDGKTRETSIFERSFRVPFSGMLSSLKGDVRTNIKLFPKQLMIECKERKSAGYTLTVESVWIEKLFTEADAESMVPVLCLSFKGAKDRIYVVVRRKDFSFYGRTLVFPTEIGNYKLERERIREGAFLFPNKVVVPWRYFREFLEGYYELAKKTSGHLSAEQIHECR